jgi:hypothetical protein
LTAEVHGSLILNFLKIIFTGFRQVWFFCVVTMYPAIK